MKKLILLLFVLLITNIYTQEISNLEIRLDDINNNSVLLSEITKNKITYLNFWALWCQPCRAELKPLNLIHEKYKDKDFQVISINIDNPKSVSKVKSFVKSIKIDFMVLLDQESKIFKLLNGQSLPYSLIIGKSGKIEQVRTGYLPGDENDIENKIVELLGK